MDHGQTRLCPDFDASVDQPLAHPLAQELRERPFDYLPVDPLPRDRGCGQTRQVI